MRANAGEIDYKNFLEQLGNGELPTIDEHREVICLPERCVIPEGQSIITSIFGERLNPNDISVYSKAILCPKNDAR